MLFTDLRCFISSYHQRREQIQYKVNEEHEKRIEENSTVKVGQKIIVHIKLVKGAVDVISIQQAEKCLERFVEGRKLFIEGPQHDEASQAEGQEEQPSTQQELDEFREGYGEGAVQGLEGGRGWEGRMREGGRESGV